MEAADCLGDETIAAMLEGALAGEAAERARSHITRCDACRRLVSAAIDVVGPTMAIAATASGLTGSFGTTSVPIAGGTAALRAGLPIGTVVAGRYRIEGVVGEGGMGVVFAARQLGLDRLVALKVLSARLAGDGVALARFRREGRLVATLDSENVVSIHDFGALETGEPFLAMEMLEGEDLAKIAARGPSSVEDAAAWIGSACEGLGEAHLLGIVHRDVKPSNIFLTRTRKVKVLDFGLAKLCAPVGQTAVTATGIVLGTPGYIAPEQILGARDVDARADVFALGATLYHLVTGRPPFVDTSFELVMRRIASGATPSVEGVRPDVGAIVLRCLARDPRQRFASARELGEALGTLSSRAVIGSAPTHTAPPPIVIAPMHAPAPPQPFAPRPTSRGAGVSGGTIALFIALAIVGIVVVGLVGGGVVVYRTMAAVPPGASASGPSGPSIASAMDEARISARLAKLGWTVTRTSHETFPGCAHTDFLIDKPPVKNANVRLLECDSRGIASSEKARLQRGFPAAAVEAHGEQVLIVQLENAADSRALATALQAP